LQIHPNSLSENAEGARDESAPYLQSLAFSTVLFQISRVGVECIALGLGHIINVAREALTRPGEHVSALRELFGRLLAQEIGLRAIAEELSDVDIRNDKHTESGDPHPLLGKWAPNLALHNDHRATQVAKLMKAGKGVFVELGEPSRLSELALKWAGRVDE